MAVTDGGARNSIEFHAHRQRRAIYMCTYLTRHAEIECCGDVLLFLQRH